ncbi:MAG: DUF4136 domain-containing protein, partial [Flavobacteriaceae bacterium]|nr:DUF4136 domain-containing protein [Flavobacteriaceae bacterium]
MKKSMYLFGAFLSLLLLTSCSSIRVFTDYDTEVNFSNYSSFAFYKPTIDQAEISDLDKRRILKSIESQMTAKGYVLAENADLL